MPNQITAAGLETKTQAELVAEFTAAMQAIYGVDINLEQDTPDGQMMLIFIQSTLDNLDLITQIYNSFNPDNAIGVTLDQRVTYNGIQRQAGTFTITNITVVVSSSLNIFGLDQTIEEVYTVADNAGNEWQLLSTQTISVAGSYIFSFQSAVAGEILTIPNTITVPVTIVLGVASVNNPSTYTTLGIDEESDKDLKIRRLGSVSLSSQGYLPGLLAALENITGIISAFVYENRTGLVDADGTPGHTIWVVVSGTADDALIADAIYRKRNAGVGMRGAQSYVVTQVDGTLFTVYWDDVVAEDLFIKFTVAPLDGVTPINYVGLSDFLVNNYIPGVNAPVNSNSLAAVAQNYDNNAFLTDVGFSFTSGGVYTPVLEPSTKTNQFVLSPANIIILPIKPVPSVLSIATTGERTFTATGGYGAYVWSLEVDNSGASINPGTGLYTAGVVAGQDTIRVTDALGNFKNVLIEVF